MTLHDHFQVISWLHILKFKSCYLILVCQTWARRMPVQLQVPADPPLGLSSQSTGRKHLTAQTSELLANMVSKIYSCLFLTFQNLQNFIWVMHAPLCWIQQDADYKHYSNEACHIAQLLHYPRVLRNCKEVNIHLKNNTLKSSNPQIIGH